MSFAGNAAAFALCLYCRGISVCAVMSLIVRLLSVGEPLSCKICDRRQSGILCPLSKRMRNGLFYGQWCWRRESACGERILMGLPVQRFWVFFNARISASRLNIVRLSRYTSSSSCRSRPKSSVLCPWFCWGDSARGRLILGKGVESRKPL